ncbi:MAG: histone deacetylase [Bacteroidota bacterium]
MLKIFHSDRFVPSLPEGHRFPIQKYQLIREQLLYEGSIDESQLEESFPVSEEDILSVHTETYWTAMREVRIGPKKMRRIGFPQSAQLVDRSRRSCQGTVSAALHALTHGIGMNIAGGTHHAYADAGEGFCLLNDFAICAHHLFRNQLAQQILIVDLDVHQGNGTAKIFEQDSRVFTFSMHGKDNYPLHKEQSDLDIALPTGTDDEEYLNQLNRTFPDLLESVQPDLVLFQAGVDVLASDRLGKLALSREGCMERDRIVLDLCKEKDIPLAVAIGGGYSPRLADTIEAHANTFRLAARMYEG